MCWHAGPRWTGCGTRYNVSKLLSFKFCSLLSGEEIVCNKVIENSWYNEEISKLGSWFFLDSFPQYPFSGSIVRFLRLHLSGSGEEIVPMQQGYRKFLIQWRSYQVGELIFPWFFSSIFFLNIPLVEVLYAFCVCIWVEVERKLFLCNKVIESSWYNEEVNKLGSWFFLDSLPQYPFSGSIVAFCVCIWVEVEKKLFLCNKVIESF